MKCKSSRYFAQLFPTIREKKRARTPLLTSITENNTYRIQQDVSSYAYAVRLASSIQCKVDHAVAEHTAACQEFTVFVQCFQRLFQRMANCWDQCIFFWWQVVQVFRRCFTWMNLVLNTVQDQPSSSRSEAQVWVRQWIWEACFNATCFRIRNVRNTNRSRTVLRRVCQFHWCFNLAPNAL